MGKDSRLVYSTDSGRIKPQSDVERTAPGDGIIRIRVETKGRNGKGVSVIWGFDLDEAGLKKMASSLKQHCGTGGSVKQRTIEIQGDQRDKLKAKLESLGYTVKFAGG